MDKELKQIKKLYGEKFMQFCRDNFSTILDNDGALLQLLQKLFNPSKSLYDDLKKMRMLDDFVVFINSKYEESQKTDEVQQEIDVPSPAELMDKAGYVLYKCETVEDVEMFMKYYAYGESLCTFDEIEDRLSTHTIFFAVKKDVDKIRREDFDDPQRQDDYGTSVISLQFTKTTGYLSIKNRYNHVVDDPDATFSNNLDNIYPGLSESFDKHYALGKSKNKKRPFVMSGYVQDLEGKYYKCNYQDENIYYCEDNIVIKDGVVYQYPKDRYELIDHFLYDKDTETIVDLEAKEDQMPPDSFVSTFDNVDKVDIIKGENGGRIFVVTDKEGKVAQIGVDKSNRIVSYSNHNLTELPPRFLHRGKHLEKIDLPNVEIMGSMCFDRASSIQEVSMPKLTRMGDYCFTFASKLTTLSMDSLTKMGRHCFSRCDKLKVLDLPNLISMGERCFDYADVEQINLPQLIDMEDGCFEFNYTLRKLILPNLQRMGEDCFKWNYSINTISMDKLTKMGSYCFGSACVKKVILPNLIEMGDECFAHYAGTEEISMDKLEHMGGGCFMENMALKEVSLPSLQTMGELCFAENQSIIKLSLDSLIAMGYQCFQSNIVLEELNLPLLEVMGYQCFEQNAFLKRFIAPLLKEIGGRCFARNRKLETIEAPSLQQSRGAFGSNRAVRQLIEQIIDQNSKVL